MRGMSLVSLLFFAVVGVSTVGCASFGTTEIDDPPSDGVAAPGAPGAPGAGPGPSADPAGPGATPAGGPNVTIHVRATQAPVAHDPGSAGQTPTLQRMAFKSLTLYATREDAASGKGYEVYDLGGSPVEASLGHGDDTVLKTLPIRSLKPGRYTYARVGVAYLRFNVRSTMHSLGFAVPGEFENVQVLANDTLLDGQRRQKGYYRYTFKSPQTGPVSVEGQDAPLPQTTGQGGIALESGPGGLTYGFPIDMTIDPGVTQDLHAIYEVNTHENFRWQDQPTLGFTAGVYDTTPTTFEPIVSFGANAARLYWEQ